MAKNSQERPVLTGETKRKFANFWGDPRPPHATKDTFYKTTLYCRQCGNQEVWVRTGNDYYHGFSGDCTACGDQPCCLEVGYADMEAVDKLVKGKPE